MGENAAPYPNQAVIVPSRVIAPQFDFERLQAIPPDPIPEQHRVTVHRFLAGQVCCINCIQPTHQMPGHQMLTALRAEEIGRVFSGEGQTAGTVIRRR